MTKHHIYADRSQHRAKCGRQVFQNGEINIGAELCEKCVAADYREKQKRIDTEVARLREFGDPRCR